MSTRPNTSIPPSLYQCPLTSPISVSISVYPNTMSVSPRSHHPVPMSVPPPPPYQIPYISVPPVTISVSRNYIRAHPVPISMPTPVVQIVSNHDHSNSHARTTPDINSQLFFHSHEHTQHTRHKGKCTSVQNSKIMYIDDIVSLV